MGRGSPTNRCSLCRYRLTGCVAQWDCISGIENVVVDCIGLWHIRRRLSEGNLLTISRPLTMKWSLGIFQIIVDLVRCFIAEKQKGKRDRF